MRVTREIGVGASHDKKEHDYKGTLARPSKGGSLGKRANPVELGQAEPGTGNKCK